MLVWPLWTRGMMRRAGKSQLLRHLPGGVLDEPHVDLEFMRPHLTFRARQPDRGGDSPFHIKNRRGNADDIQIILAIVDRKAVRSYLREIFQQMAE